MTLALKKVVLLGIAGSLLAASAATATVYQVTPTQTLVDANNLSPVPTGGDIVEIQAGTGPRLGLQLRNFTGTPGNPIIFRNSGGQVVITDPNANSGINFNNCKHFKITGTGDPAYLYGFKVSVSKGGSVGVGFGNLSTNFIAERLEIAQAGFAGIMSKTDPGCNPSAWRENFTQYETHFWDNYIHDTGGEGMYIGNTSWSGRVITNCNGQTITVYPHEIRGVSIRNNIVRDTGWDGIQLSCATEDASIENNWVYNFGLEVVSGQNQGIQLGAGSDADVFNNVVDTGTGGGIMIFGLGGSAIYNNIIYRPNGDGIFCDDRATIPGRGWAFNNNTIVEPGRDGLRIYSDESTGNTFYNNIVAGYGRLVSGNPYHKLNSSVQLAVANNYSNTSVSAVGFTHAANRDFHLQASSPAIDVGQTVGAYDYDIDYLPRPSGSAYDAGAVEYTGAVLLQNFSGSQALSAYQHATAPTNGQFNDISAEADGGTWSVNGGVLQITREGLTGSNSGSGFTRHTNMATAPTVLYANFDFGLTNYNTYQNDSMLMDFCNYGSVTDYNGSTPSTGVFASLRIDGSGGNTFKFEVSGTRSAAFAADGTMYKVSVYLNKTGSAQSYTAPDGTTKTLNSNSVSVWVGDTAAITNVLASNGGTSALTDIRTRILAPDSGTWRFDNFAIYPALP